MLPGTTTEFAHYRIVLRSDGTLWELDRDAAGACYKALDVRQSGKFVTLKVIPSEYLAGENAATEFLRFGTRAATDLRHSNIAPILHCGQNAAGFFYATEYLPGAKLSDLVTPGRPLPPPEAVNFVLQIARGLTQAHRLGLCHLDLRPSNVTIVDENAALPRVKIAGFHFVQTCRLDGESELMAVGEPEAMSPEQMCLEDKAIGPASDVYALGAILWYLLTGRQPFAGRPMQSRKSFLDEPLPLAQLHALKVPGPLRARLKWMLARNPRQRLPPHPELTRLLAPPDLCCFRPELFAALEEVASQDEDLQPPAASLEPPSTSAISPVEPDQIRPPASGAGSTELANAGTPFRADPPILPPVEGGQEAAIKQVPITSVGDPKFTPDPIVVHHEPANSKQEDKRQTGHHVQERPWWNYFARSAVAWGTAGLILMSATGYWLSHRTAHSSASMSTPAPDHSDELQRALSEGRTALDRGDYETGFAAYRRAQALSKDSALAKDGIDKIRAFATSLYAQGLKLNTTDQDKAQSMIRRAAALGNPDGQVDLGWWYQNHQGHAAEDRVEGMKLYCAAAEQGSPRGQCCLGEDYRDGVGVAVNPDEAVRLFRASADQAYSSGSYNLGMAYKAGLGKLGRNMDEAVAWLTKAAAQGLPESAEEIKNIGYQYEKGEGGVEKDLPKAADLYTKAAALGSTSAVDGLISITVVDWQGLWFGRAQ